MPPDAEDRIIQAVSEIVNGTEKRLNESIGTLRVQFVRLVGRQDMHEEKCKLQHKHLDDKFCGLQTTVDEIQDKQEVTGQHEVAALQKKAEAAEAGRQQIITKHQETVQHWHRYLIGIVGTLFLTVVAQFVLMKLHLK